MTAALREFHVEGALVKVYATKTQMGHAAGMHGAAILRDAVAEHGRARIIVACAPSQEATMKTLTQSPGIDWNRVDVLHMDEYVGLPASHSASFRRWLKMHLVDVVHPGRVEYLHGDAPDLEAECQRYSEFLRAAPINICFLGFGENGHIAFNDPHAADFEDPDLVKIVTLDQECRAQQTAEGHFPTLKAVPSEAVTLTCPALLGAEYLVCSVPGSRKAEAVKNAIEGPLSHDCPGSAVFVHPHASVFLDKESASLLSNGTCES